MTTELALAMIESRMQDMGFARNQYSVLYAHLVLQGGEQREIEAANDLYVLEHDPEDVRIRSDFGFFDLSYPAVNELSYEHYGLIRLRNLSGSPVHVRFIHVILKHLNP